MRRLLFVCALVACGERGPMYSPRPFVTAAGDPSTGEAYHDWGKNPWMETSVDHLSTFAADVDTASYTLARRKLESGELPATAAVRVEEWVNYFGYALPHPRADSPFGVVMDAAPSPFDPNRYVLRVAVGTAHQTAEQRRPANLVFLVDTSGSMDAPDRFPLVQKSLRILLDHLTDRDTVALATYAGTSRLVLPATSMRDKARIERALDDLHAEGSTAMAGGIDVAYAQAMKGLAPGVISRVIVCTDGDANVGPHSYEEMLALIADRAKQGVSLSTIGFGVGNYKDETLEQLADKGNGNNYYIDNEQQAERVFGEQLESTLEVVAKDVKLQVDFDPTQVARYRLIGYENRDVADKDFRNDKVAAGQVGPGHEVTALYELELQPNVHGSLGLVRIRHKAPDGTDSRESQFPMAAAPAPTFAQASPDLQFAFAVAAFADVLRDGPDAKTWSLDAIRTIAAASAGADHDRSELVSLIDRARQLRGGTKVAR